MVLNLVRLGVFVLVGLLFQAQLSVSGPGDAGEREGLQKVFIEGRRGWAEDGVNLWTSVSPLPSYNVGIGTSTPAYKLDIVGNTRVQGLLYINSWPIQVNAAPSVGQVLKWTGSAFVPQDDAGVGDCEWLDAGSYLYPRDQSAGEVRIYEDATNAKIVAVQTNADYVTIGARFLDGSFGQLGAQTYGVFGRYVSGGTTTPMWGYIGTSAWGVYGNSGNPAGGGVGGFGGTTTSGVYGETSAGDEGGGWFVNSGTPTTSTSIVGGFAVSWNASPYLPPLNQDAGLSGNGRYFGMFGIGQNTAAGAQGRGVLGLGNAYTTIPNWWGQGVMGVTNLAGIGGGVLGFGAATDAVGVVGIGNNFTTAYYVSGAGVCGSTNKAGTAGSAISAAVYGAGDAGYCFGVYGYSPSSAAGTGYGI
ncbi:MAG: hypothetical protein ABDH49_07435, partial [Candidatus Hydrothermales bacterium]